MTWKIFLVYLVFWCISVDSATVNILWINEANLTVSTEAIRAAFDVFARNSSLGINVVVADSVDVANVGEGIMALEKVCSALDSMIDAKKPPDLILDSTRSGDASDAIKSLTRSLGLPTVALSYGLKGEISDWRDLSVEQEKYLVQIRPPGDVITMSIRTLVSSQNITSAAVLYDETFVMDYQFVSLFINIPVRHVIQEVHMNDIATQLKHFNSITLNNIFILGTTDTIAKVMKVASELKLFGAKFAWFALTKDEKKDFICECSDVNVLYFRPTPSNNLGNVQDFRRISNVQATPDIDLAFYYDATIMAIKAVSKMKDVGSWPKDMVYTKCKDFTATDAVVRSNLDLRQNMKTTVVAPTYGPMVIGSNGQSYMQFIVDISKLQFSQNKLMRTNAIATWSANAPVALTSRANATLAGFIAVTFYRVVTVAKPPFIYKDFDKDGKVFYTGYCVDLIQDLSKLLRFEYEIYEPPDGEYGTLNEKLEWTGMMRELVEGRADIGIGAIQVMAERESFVDFSIPYYDMIGTVILMKLPNVPTSLFKFLSVLDDTVWGCIVAAYFVTSFLLWIFDRFSPYSYQNNLEKYKDDDERRYFDLKECLWFCMTSLTPQGGGEAPKCVSGRLLAATWWLFGFIIIASYTANLAAFLTVSRLETPITSLDDLSKQYKIKYSPMNNSDAMIYFQRRAYIEEKFYQIWKNMSLDDSMNDYDRAQLAVWDYPIDDTYTKMWQTMVEAGMPNSLEEAIERIRNPPDGADYAYLGDAADLKYQLLLNCDLQIVGEEFSRKPYAIAVQQGSPLKDMVNDGILQLQNMRRLEMYKQQWWNENPFAKNCDEVSGGDSGGGISIYNIGGVFIVILVGIVLAFFTLIFEYWYYKNHEYVEDPNDPHRYNDANGRSKRIIVKQFAGDKATIDREADSATAYRRSINQRITPASNRW